MFTNSIDVEIKKYAENNRTYNNNTSCMYPRNFRMCSFSIRGQSSKGGGHELLVKSDIGDTLNIGVVPNHWHLMIDHVHAIIHHHHHHNYACKVEDSEDGAESLDVGAESLDVGAESLDVGAESLDVGAESLKYQVVNHHHHDEIFLTLLPLHSRGLGPPKTRQRSKRGPVV